MNGAEDMVGGDSAPALISAPPGRGVKSCSSAFTNGDVFPVSVLLHSPGILDAPSLTQLLLPVRRLSHD